MECVYLFDDDGSQVCVMMSLLCVRACVCGCVCMCVCMRVYTVHTHSLGNFIESLTLLKASLY